MQAHQACMASRLIPSFELRDMRPRSPVRLAKPQLSLAIDEAMHLQARKHNHRMLELRMKTQALL